MEVIKRLFILAVVLGVARADGLSCCAHGPRKDCGFAGIDQQTCEAKGCCWLPRQDGQGPHVDEPWCVFSNAGRSDYVLHSADEQGSRMVASLVSLNRTAPELGPDIPNLQLSVEALSADTLHVKISDAKQARWEVPASVFPFGSLGAAPAASEDSDLDFSYAKEPFSFNISRAGSDATSAPLFSTAGLRLVFKDQYLELNSRVPASSMLFGLNERTNSRGLALPRDGLPLTLWNRDMASFTPDSNLYGSHPFIMEVRKDGSTHGILLLNSNGMDVVLTPDRLSFRIIGGIMDLYVFAGPTPGHVMDQMTRLVGKPAMPPFWSLGFHQCRWGYKTIADMQEVVERYAQANIPMETIWSDIDHMDGYRDFTLDPANYPAPDMAKFVEQLHAKFQRWVPIVDPGIKVDVGYAPYDTGLREDVFLKDVTGKPYMSQVWPGATHHPDFSNPKTTAYWTANLQAFHRMAAFDGLWIDMNEASNFCTGDVCELVPGSESRLEGLPAAVQRAQSSHSALSTLGSLATLRNSACFLRCTRADAYNTTLPPELTANLNNPPYAISNGNAHEPLERHTIPMTVSHHDGTLQYNTHNLYGLTEAIATHAALRNITGERPFVLTRSSFLGTGAVAAHWTGDNAATWDDLRWSISSVLNSGLVGVPFVGADICGFSGETTEELCARWISAGAFYPFSRDHSTGPPQELYLWEQTAAAGRKALALRYQLLPYLYTAFHHSSSHGCPVARPLFYAWPADGETHAVHQQWLLGDGVLVSPVLDQGVDKVEAYIPAGTWYSLWDRSVVDTRAGGKRLTLDAPLGDVPVHALGGVILPMQQAALTTTAVRESALSLLVALPAMEKSTATSTRPQPFAASRRHLLSDHIQLPSLTTTEPSPAASNQGPLRCGDAAALAGCGVSEPGRVTACGQMFLDTDANLEAQAELGNYLHFFAEVAVDTATGAHSGQVVASFTGSTAQACADVAWPTLDQVTVLGLEEAADANTVTVEVWQPADEPAPTPAEPAGHTLDKLLSSTVLQADQVRYDADAQRLQLVGLAQQVQCPHSLRITWRSASPIQP